MPQLSNTSLLPHIVYMLADNIGYGNIGYIRAASPAGPSTEVQTPNIDGLASTGVVLERLYTFEFCSPSRSSLLTGRLPAHVNLHNDDQTRPGAGIPEQMTSIAAKLAGAGYHTHHLGKWHTGFATPRHTPLGRGFQTSLGYIAGACNGYLHGWTCSGGHGVANVTCPQYPGFASYPADANGTIPTPSEGARCTAASVEARHLGFVTDLWQAEGGSEGPATSANITMDGHGWEEALFTARATKLIRRHASMSAGAPVPPFFLYYAMHLLHSPLCAPPAILNRFAFIDHEDRRYVSAMAFAMDAAVGDVVDALKASHMWERTLFIWTSDNGAAIEQVTGGKSAYPLRGGYYTNWEVLPHLGIPLAPLAKPVRCPPERPTPPPGLVCARLPSVAGWGACAWSCQRRMASIACARNSSGWAGSSSRLVRDVLHPRRRRSYRQERTRGGFATDRFDRHVAAPLGREHHESAWRDTADTVKR